MKFIKKYRVGIIGCGRMASLFEEDPLMKKPCTHAGAYNSIPQTEIVSACDIRNDRLSKFSKKWSVKSLYTNYKEMLKKERLDIVSVCTHAPKHHEITIEAAEAGVSAIFCEKPMATCLKEADEMIKVCKKNNVILVIDHTRRWDSDYRKVKEIIDSGKIEKIIVVNSYSTAGLLNAGTHLFDLLRFYNGDVDSVFGHLKLDGTTDPSGIGLLNFKNGSFGFFDCDFRNYLLFEIDLVGSNGRIIAGGMIRGDKGFELWYPIASKYQSGLFELYKNNLPKLSGSMPLVNAVHEIIESIETGKKPVCTGEDGRAALEIALAFHESDRLGKKIKLPLKNKNLRVIPRETSFTKSGKIDG